MPTPPAPPPIITPTDDPGPSAAKLEGDYFRMVDFDKRTKIIVELGELNSPQASQSLARLIPMERNAELKAAMMVALADIEGAVDQKLTIFSAALAPTEPEDVREAAAEGLRTVNDLRAIPVWERLVNDKNLEVRASAKAAINGVKSGGH